VQIVSTRGRSEHIGRLGLDADTSNSLHCCQCGGVGSGLNDNMEFFHNPFERFHRTGYVHKLFELCFFPDLIDGDTVSGPTGDVGQADKQYPNFGQNVRIAGTDRDAEVAATVHECPCYFNTLFFCHTLSPLQ
jgi:hypothetical protein